MEKLKLFETRMARRMLAGALGMVLFSGCGSVDADGQHSSPTIEEIQEDAEYVKLTRPDGSTMTCLFYSKRGSEGHQGFSWLIKDCDWANAYDGPVTGEQLDTGEMDCRPADNDTFVCESIQE